MPDPAHPAASSARPTSAPASLLPAVNSGTERPRRYRIHEAIWGSHKRFVVRDTATNTTIAIRTTRDIADSDLMRLNWDARGDPKTAPQPAPSEPPPK